MILLKKITLILSMVLFSFSSLLNAQQRTLLTKDGEIIRGTAIAVAKNYEKTSNAFCNDPASWKLIKSKHLNTVRVCWVDPWFERRDLKHWKVTDPNVTKLFDKAVKNAVANNMTIVINYHSAGDQAEVREKHNDDSSKMMKPEGFKRIKQFWEIIAPRYKNNPNVIYEIINEPCFGHNEYLADPFKKDFLEVYNMVREMAPQREIIMFSFNGINYDLETVINGYNDEIDWSKTSIGYHLYQKDRSAHVRRLAKNYRVICTEWDYPKTHSYVMPVDGYGLNSEFLELYQHAWLDWSDWDNNTLEHIDNELIPEAEKNDYAWWKKSDVHKITVRATGAEKNEALNVLVNDEKIGSFTPSDSLENFKFKTYKNIKNVKIELPKTDSIENIKVDYVVLDGVFRDSENQLKNTSVFQNEKCGGLLSESINCKGHIDYGDFSKKTKNIGYVIKIRLKGVTGDENVQILAGSTLLKEFNPEKKFKDYFISANLRGNIKVAFTNDEGDKDIQVDYAEINYKKYEAEDMPTNTGVFKDGTCGGGFSEFMNCNGYILFPSVE